MTVKLVIVGDQAFTSEEWDRAERRRMWERIYKRERYGSDPEYRERCKAASRAWRQDNPTRKRDYNREWMRRNRHGENAVPIRAVASLHDLRCTGPTRSTGCRCRKVTLYERVA